MAFLGDNLLESGQGQDEEELLAQGAVVGGGVGGAGGGAFIAGSPTGGGAGSGGMSRHVNLQSYLNANQAGDPGSANIVKGAADKSLGGARTGIQSAFDAAKSGAQAAGQKGQVDTSNFGSFYGGKFQAGEDLIRMSGGEALGGKYGLGSFAPQGFNYQFGEDFNGLEGSLADPMKFREYRDSVYRDNSPVGMTTGMSALQRQFDSANPALDDMRRSALGEIASLKTQKGALGDEYGAFEGAQKATFDQGQDQYKGFLNQALGSLGDEYRSITDEGLAPKQPAGNSYEQDLGLYNHYKNNPGPQADKFMQEFQNKWGNRTRNFVSGPSKEERLANNQMYQKVLRDILSGRR